MPRRAQHARTLSLLAASSFAALAAQDPPRPAAPVPELPDAGTLSGLKLRALGPALSSGRISDIAVDPADSSRWFVGVASGGVWRTDNHGATFTPVFDDQGSYSIGCVAIDPNNRHVVWVGTGENNSQRSVSFGDGVYKSVDGGQSWRRMGLEDSEHIGRIAIDPTDGNVVYVAAQGPLWRAGEQRGLYKTTDGGETWTRVLHVSEHTGINEVHLDPRDPRVLWASAYQRRRHVWTLVNGGPESAIYKSTDGGATWRKVTRGLPAVDLGRIGLAVSPANPDVLYAIVEAQRGQGGVFRSTDRGESWSKQSGKVSSSPQYYNELVCDPLDPDVVYCLDTFTTVSRDGGRTWTTLGNLHRHVDDHALWIDPANTRHILIGGDGGLYESWDAGAHWVFFSNLPVTQFYRVSTDQARPFYNVYGGTQDNNSMGGPSRTTRLGGITNDDWFVTVTGDGYEVQVDPEDENIVYTQYQYGGLMRLDRRSGELVDIKPREDASGTPLKWNWDTPLLLSAHARTRLYVAANRLFRSDDRGDSWRAISGDLTRGIDRDALEVMGRVQDVDAVAKDSSTSFYGNCTALAESPLDENLLWVGTDDGLVHVTEDGGANWTRIDTFPGVPDRTYVSRLTASFHRRDRVYAAFDNHKNGDFTPYLLVSEDRGRTWRSIRADLGPRDIVYAIVEDDEDEDLLFCGTEFGVYASLDRGRRWIELTGNMPTIQVRDLEIQRREDDLIVGTFGRGIYVLDDYSPLRTLSAETCAAPAHLFTPRPAPLYVPGNRLGLNTGLGTQGSLYFAAPNPPFGAIVTYWLAEKPMTRREKREDAQRKAREAGTTIPYPTYEELRAEDEEVAPVVYLTVRDAHGAVVRRVECPRAAGLHRVAWDLRWPKATRTELHPPGEGNPWSPPDAGPLVPPGEYQITLDLLANGETRQLAGPVPCRVVPLGLQSLPAADPAALLAFQNEAVTLRRAVRAAIESADDLETRLAHARLAVREAPRADLALLGRLGDMARAVDEILIALRGDLTLIRRNRPSPPSIASRVEAAASSTMYSTAAPTATAREDLRIAAEAFTAVHARLRALLTEDWPAVEAALEAAGAPTTPGRLPAWR